MQGGRAGEDACGTSAGHRSGLDPVARMTGVSCRFRNGGGLQGVSLAVEEGEWVSVFGPPGSGKSTLLALLAGELQPEMGEVAAARAAFVAEDLPKPGRLSARDRLLRRLAQCGVAATRRAGRAVAAMEVVGLDTMQDAPERFLSVGRRVALEIAAAIACEPALLLLDNVTAALPEPLRDRIFSHLDDRRAADGLTVIHATCSSREAERSDRVLMLHEGRPLTYEPTSELMRRMAPPRVAVEAADPAAVQRTLRGIFDVEVTETGDGFRFAAADPVDVAAHLFRHPSGGVRVVYAARGDLWSVHERLAANRS